jgi:hypothetical protein
MAKPKQHKLDLFQVVLPALDKGQKNFYSNLGDDEKKAYTPLILMRAISSLGDQNPNVAIGVLAVNDLVNIGFWTLSKHPELQHLLLCVTGLGSKQYHPWLATKGKGNTATKEIDAFLTELNPGINELELNLLRSMHNADTIETLAIDAGKSDLEIKHLLNDAKNLT